MEDETISRYLAPPMSHVFAMYHLGQLVAVELSKGGCWRRKDKMGPAMSFSLATLNEAGGVRKLLDEWEQVP